jgi:hypothetical protein
MFLEETRSSYSLYVPFKITFARAASPNLYPKIESAKMETEAGPTAVANELSKAPWAIEGFRIPLYVDIYICMHV